MPDISVVRPAVAAALLIGASLGPAVPSGASTSTATTSGSILSPSVANSMVGIKPTVGLVSRNGIIPLAHSFDTAGPIARDVTDAAVLLSAISVPDPSDVVNERAPGGPPPAHDYLAIIDSMFSANALSAYAAPDAAYAGSGAAAGYPSITIPDGYTSATVGTTPHGIRFLGVAWSEPSLTSSYCPAPPRAQTVG